MSISNAELHCPPYTMPNISEYKCLVYLRQSDPMYWNLIGVVFIPLILCIIIVWPFYVRIFHKILVQYTTSPFLPMITYEYRAIKYIYPLLLISSMIAFAARDNPILALPTLIATIILACTINWFSFTYETLLGLMSIHKYLNMGHLTKRTVVISMCLILLIVITKDIGFFFVWSIDPIFSYSHRMLDKVLICYYISYVSFQIILFFGMVFQFSMKTDLLGRQTKIIGAAKQVLFAIFVFGSLTEILPAAGPIFVCVDGLLVPLAVMLVDYEIICSIEPVDEFKKVPLKV